jgi:hypothetical protein
MVDINEIISQRRQLYGDFMRQAAIASDMKGIMRSYTDWEDTFAADQREALDMIVVKLARILNGDPNHADSWIDIAGYAQLIANRLTHKESE